MVGLCRLADRFQAYSGQEYGPFVAELLQVSLSAVKLKSTISSKQHVPVTVRVVRAPIVALTWQVHAFQRW